MISSALRRLYLDKTGGAKKLSQNSACAAGEGRTKRRQDAGRPNSSCAIWPTEDAAPRSEGRSIHAVRRRQGCAGGFETASTATWLAGRFSIGLILAVAGSLVLAAPPAFAYFHTFSTSFGAEPSTPRNPYPLSNPSDVAVDNSSGPSKRDVYVTDPANHRVEKFTPSGEFLLMFGKAVNKTAVAASGTEAEQDVCTKEPGEECQPGEAASTPGAFTTPTFLAVDNSAAGEGDLYVADRGDSIVSKFTPEGALIGSWGNNGAGGSANGQLSGFGGPIEGIAVDPKGNFFVLGGQEPFTYWFEQSGMLHSKFSHPCCTSPSGLAVDAEDDLYKAAGGPYITKFTDIGGPLGELTENVHAVGLAIDPPTNDLYAVESGSAVDHFSHACSERCSPLESFGSGDLNGAEGLAIDAFTHTVYVADTGDQRVDVFPAVPPPPPAIGNESVSDVLSDRATLAAQINPGGGETTYRFEYGTVACSDEPDPCTSTPHPDAEVGSGATYQEVSAQLGSLTPGTTYHWRVVASSHCNLAEPEVQCTTKGPDGTFTTYPFTPVLEDHCPNAHVRQQTGAAELLDCRAYELVSATNAGGYDVESDLVAGQTPYAGYPEAEGRVLYGVHDGAIPEVSGDPTNRGVDPYVATRGKEGWSTEYVGVPANNPFSATPFSSTPSDADSSLDTFAFGSSEGCSPCFEGGYTGIPVRLPNGKLVQGMVAAKGVPTPPPSATPDGYIATDLSANGEHLIFGSTTQFAEGGNPSTGNVSIYDRNLNTEETHLISNSPEGKGHPLACLKGAGECHSPGDANGISELDISSEGTHILLGQKVSTDAGNNYWHLYMNIGDSEKTIALTPGATGNTGGVLFDGMSADGSKVFFSSEEHLTGEDTSHSGADIFMWSQKGEEEGKPLTLISKGDSASCDPVADSAHEHWNTVGSEEVNCGVVAIGGGGGVSSANGTIYFLSPEQLAGSEHGTLNAPNLYVAGPEDGYAPHYVTTLESVLTGPQPPALRHTFLHNFGSFTNANAIAVDHKTHDVYVADVAAGTLDKFNEKGEPADFTASEPYIPTNGHGEDENKITGLSYFLGSGESQVAVNSESGTVYLTSANSVEAFQANGEPADFTASEPYIPTNGHGEDENKITGFGELLGVAVDANGDVYAGDYQTGVHVYAPSGKELVSFATEHPANLAVDSHGDVYVNHWHSSVEKFTPSAFPVTASTTYASHGTVDPNEAFSLAVDSATDDVYVDEGTQIAQYDSSANKLTALGAGDLTGSVGLALDPGGNLYATAAAGTEVAVFPSSLAPGPLIDNPALLDSVTEAGTRHTADFQVTPDGRFAAFTSTLPLPPSTKYDNAGHSEIYRYDATTEELNCASCDPTGVKPSFGSTLASNGLSLTDDGRVFFTTAEPLVARDLDEKADVYEWEPAGTGNCQESSQGFSKASGTCLELISTGTSPFDSGLLSVSANGTDVYFFTRDSLVPQDQNGSLTKIYDARELGGFLFIPQPPPCAASDECHGPGSQAQQVPPIRTVAGGADNVTEPKKCKPGFVSKHGRCVRHERHKGKKHKHRATHHRKGSVRP